MNGGNSISLYARNWIAIEFHRTRDKGYVLRPIYEPPNYIHADGMTFIPQFLLLGSKSYLCLPCLNS